VSFVLSTPFAKWVNMLKPKNPNSKMMNNHTHHEENMPSLEGSTSMAGLFVSNSGKESLFEANIINKRHILNFHYICILILINYLFQGIQVKELV
jgi:hypothetical protein